MKNVIVMIFTLGTALATLSASATVIGGVDFPDGAVSFADAVVSYTEGTNVGPGWNNPDNALGVPDYTGGTDQAVSLGIGGELILKFTDNSLTTSGDTSNDLYIFEIGAVTEYFNVAISQDNVTWIDLGDVLGQPTGVNIDGVSGVVDGALYSYVRLRDIPPDNQSPYPYGEADIDAVGAISNAPPAGNGGTIPEPGTLYLALLGMLLIGLGNKNRKQAH